MKVLNQELIYFIGIKKFQRGSKAIKALPLRQVLCQYIFLNVLNGRLIILKINFLNGHLTIPHMKFVCSRKLVSMAWGDSIDSLDIW